MDPRCLIVWAIILGLLFFAWKKFGHKLQGGHSGD
jgi:hypothetical protein